MLYSAIEGICFISANGSIESPQTVHYFDHQNVTTKMADQDLKESHENCKLRKALEVEQK